MENTFDIHNWQAKHLTKLVKEEIDYDSAGKIQAIINHLIDSERQDVLDVLGEIPEWNELVTQAADM